ncbi:MAG: dockerin type I repeat-containing protein [Clostridia bacterium]|nr:dockerin type I repeat-containing protein [Clostridia bacterium]
MIRKWFAFLMSVVITVSLIGSSFVFAVGKVQNEDEIIHMFICYGQSWSTGYDASAITTEPRYDNLMLDTGIMTDPLSDLTAVATSFLPAVEKTQTTGQKKGETPVSAQMNMVKQLMESEDGLTVNDLSYQLLGTAPGMGSKTLAQLEKGTVYYDRLIEQVRQACQIAKDMGKRLVVEAFSWVQGSLGRSGNYAEALEQLRLDIDTDVKAITGQTEVVKCITWQSFIYNKSLRAKQVYDQYVGAAQDYPHIICAGATYHLNNVRVANLHLNSESQDWLGAYFGVAYKRTIIDGVKLEPLQPIGFHVDGNELYVKFHVPYGSLVFDGDYFTDATNEVENEGFELFAADGTKKTIADISIISSDTVKILCTEKVLGTDRLSYGDISTDAYQWVNVNRGHLRDTQGDVLRYKSGNVGDNHSELPLHNWCVIFDKTIDSLEHFEVIPSVILGDVDGNGKVNNRDLGLMQRVLNESDLSGQPFDRSAADMDGNGKLNNRDLGLLQRQLNR